MDMASIRADGHEVPFMLHVSELGLAKVSSHLLHVRFRFVELFIYVEEEVMSESGQVKESIFQQKFAGDDGHFWSLLPGHYRAFGVSSPAMATSSEIRSRHSVTSSVDMPYGTPSGSRGPGFPIQSYLTSPLLCSIKKERLEPIIELSSESEGDSPDVLASHDSIPQSTSVEIPPLIPIFQHTPSLLQCLHRLGEVRGARNELALMKFDNVPFYPVQCLPPSYNGNVVFQLPPLSSTSSSKTSRTMLDGMDKRYDGNIWCRTFTTNIHNVDNLTSRKSHCIGQLVCTNPHCDFLTRSSSKNETKWRGCSKESFKVGSDPPVGSTIVCRICKSPPTCVNVCHARIYYVASKEGITRGCIHLGTHCHPVARGTCRESVGTISTLIREEVSKTPTATNSAIAMAASKGFLESYLIHRGSGPKVMLEGKALDKVMDRFEILSSPNVRNIISSFRNIGSGGVINRIMNLKRDSTIDYIHDSVFPGQGKEKVFLFKMLAIGPGSGVELVRRMQPGGDLENAWLMFDHVKRVKDWTTMACHVYDPQYCKVQTIAVCNMQSEDTEVQCIMWRCLISLMKKHGVENPNFKGFMADCAMANWNAVRIVFGSGDSKIPMENREGTCLLHWTSSLYKHTQKLIKPNLQHQHNQLCKQYKDAKTREEAETRYFAIRAWWLSSGETTEDGIRELDLWLAFWHFRYRQWGGFWQMGMTLEEEANMPSCNLSETIHNKWLQQSGNRGNDLYAATCDDCIRAFMQMTNYRAYLNGSGSGTGPSKQELKLRASRRSGDPKKLMEALNHLKGVHEMATRVPYLEGKEVFGSSKRKLDLPIGSDGDSHRPDKVNFSQPRVQTRSTYGRSLASEQIVVTGNLGEVPHVTSVMESDCDVSQWHIARISHKSAAKCHAQQRGTKKKCLACIAIRHSSSNGTLASTYRGRKKEYNSTKVVMSDFWFCSDDIARCVMGSQRSWVLDWPEVPEVWPILIGTNLTRQETLLLQHAGFHLQAREAMSPCSLFTTSRLFEPTTFKHDGLTNPDQYPTTRKGKSIRRISNAPTTEHQNKWESARNVKGSIVNVTMLPYPGLGAIVCLETGSNTSLNVYRISISMFPECSCPSFVDMALAAIGGRPQYVNCKHLYYLFRYFCKMNLEEDKFIHAPSFSFNEVKLLLTKAGILKVDD